MINDMDTEELLRLLAIHAWDRPILMPHVNSWVEQFQGLVAAKETEQQHMLYALSRFIYFSQRIVREMLRSLYRDHFESPTIQRIRRNLGDTRDQSLLRAKFNESLQCTRFIGVGNPAESGAHLLYFFRQVNGLKKDLFTDIHSAFTRKAVSVAGSKEPELQWIPRISNIKRYVFFDDLVGSGDQVKSYLQDTLENIRHDNNDIQLEFLSLFSTTSGLARLNESDMFNGNAQCLFELDDSYKAFSTSSRCFTSAPSWFSISLFEKIAKTYGEKLQPFMPLGYSEGQLLLGFSHNTPDNTLPVFWDTGERFPWFPVFERFNKKYGG